MISLGFVDLFSNDSAVGIGVEKNWALKFIVRGLTFVSQMTSN
jgi:hypothetical protein